MTEPDQTTNTDAARSGNSAVPPNKRTRFHRRLETGAILQQVFGEDGAATLRARNWTLTGAVLVALGVVSDLMQIFGQISAWGLSLSILAAITLGLIVAFYTPWKTACVAPFVSALLFVAMFTVVLFVQRTANAADEGAIAKTVPIASGIQRAFYLRLVSLERGQAEISTRIDQLAEEIKRQSPPTQSASTMDANFVGRWQLQHSTLINWTLEYRTDGTYQLRTPDGVVNGTYKAADGWFVSEAPSVGSSDVGTYRFLDTDTLAMDGKLGASLWKRLK